MTSVHMNKYHRHLQKMAETQAREERLALIRRQKFRASIVSDPMAPQDDIANALEILRTKG